MPKTERMKASFYVKEYGTDNPLPYFLEVEPEGNRISFLSGKSDTLYINLKNEHNKEEADAVADYLCKHIEGFTLLKY